MEKRKTLVEFDSWKSLAYLKESQRGWHLVRDRESGLNEIEQEKKKDS